MNANHATPQAPRRRWWVWLLGILGASLLLLAVGVYNLLTLTRDAAVLRDSVRQAMHERPSTEIQFTAGPVLLTAARAGLAFAPNVPAEARMALRALRKASVGVYTLPHAPDATQRQAALLAADQRLAERGWHRAVAVNDGDSTVAIYASEAFGFGTREHVCVVVIEGERLVIAAGTVAAEPLVQLVEKRGGLAKL